MLESKSSERKFGYAPSSAVVPRADRMVQSLGTLERRMKEWTVRRSPGREPALARKSASNIRCSFLIIA
jgi:hypothetical protein